MCFDFLIFTGMICQKVFMNSKKDLSLRDRPLLNIRLNYRVPAKYMMTNIKINGVIKRTRSVNHNPNAKAPESRNRIVFRDFAFRFPLFSSRSLTGLNIAFLLLKQMYQFLCSILIQ